MTKVLLLGSDGLLGSCLEVALIEQLDINLITTARKVSADHHLSYSPAALRKLVREVRPNIVINCIAVTSSKNSILTTLKTNSILPIHLALLSIAYKFKVIHFGTNAVFSGHHLNNFETSIPAPKSVYAITKLLGDMSCFKNLVIRTSFIGSSPKSSISSGLVFRLQALKKDMIFEIVEDYRWNGVTTDVLCEMVLGIIKNETHARGLIHLGCKNGLQRHSLIKNILTILNKENIEVSTAVGRQPRNLTLDTRKIETVSILWSYSSFPQVPSVNELLSKMKIYNHK